MSHLSCCPPLPHPHTLKSKSTFMTTTNFSTTFDRHIRHGSSINGYLDVWKLHYKPVITLVNDLIVSAGRDRLYTFPSNTVLKRTRTYKLFLTQNTLLGFLSLSTCFCTRNLRSSDKNMWRVDLRTYFGGLSYLCNLDNVLWRIVILM